MKRKILCFFCIFFVIFLIAFKILAGNYALNIIKKINHEANINLQTEDVNFSYPVKLEFKPLKIFNKNKPFLNIELDKFTPYLLLTDLLQLVLEVKSDGTLYEGTSKINFWKNFRSDNIRGEIFLENVNLSKHQLLQSIPFAGIVEGGYLNVKNYDLKLDKNEGGYYLSYLGGDFSINDLNITRNLTIPSSLSGIIFDITIPKINFSQISSVYKYKNDTAYINNFIIKSDDFNISSKNCEFNTIKNRFSNCEIVFNFSDKGLKDFSSWLVFLGNIKFEANKDYHLELMGLNYRLINEI